MNPLAQELNTVLEGTAIYRLLSVLGKNLYFPKGIVSQSAEATARAHKLNATIGMAVEDGEPMVLESIASQVPGLSRKELAAYAPTGGIMPLRESWKQQIVQKNPSLKGKEFSLPMVVPGLTNGVFQLTELFINHSDTVLTPDLFWGNYRLVMEIRRGAEIATFSLFNEKGGFNVPALREAIEAKKSKGKIILCLNFPNNPSGYSPTLAEVDAIVAELKSFAEKGLDILVICDDAYFGLFFDKEVCRESVFAKLADAHENIVVAKIDGATKEDFVWGFRVGFVTFASKGLSPAHYDAMLKKLMGAIRGSVSSSSGLAQQICLKAYSNPKYKEQKAKKEQDLEARFHKVKEIVSKYEASGKKALKSLPFNSGYFMTFTCNGLNAETLRLKLLDDGIGTISIGDKLLRVAYSSVDLVRLDELYQAIFDKAESLKS